MGVPKFFRWISERFPLIIQRHGSPPVVETCREHFGQDPPNSKIKNFIVDERNDDLNPPNNIGQPPDALSTCGLPPAIDRLYIDMNGILHGASHFNSDELGGEREEVRDNDYDDDDHIIDAIKQKGLYNNNTSDSLHEAEIFKNICYFLDRVVKDIAKPTELVYMAIDGVAPRAKLNQQRARRYRSGKEGEIERTVFDAHMEQLERQQNEQQRVVDEESNGLERNVDTEDPYGFDNAFDFDSNSPAPSPVYGSGRGRKSPITEIDDGRLVGKFTTQEEKDDDRDLGNGAIRIDKEDMDDEDRPFNPIMITPGTPFFSRCTEHIEHFVQYKLTNDPAWKHLTIIFSGPNVPGEGEHKIMQFIREQQDMDDYNPNLRHCIMGQDGDLIMLGLVTHEPNLVLLREKVYFDRNKRISAAKHGVDAYIHNAYFEFLHMNVLRDYLAYEFRTSNISPVSPFNIERTIDDFVFLTFFVGNDFLPHMPTLDIGDESLELLFLVYTTMRQEWLDSGDSEPYLINGGNIVSAKRLESFLTTLGSFEHSYYNFKERGSAKDLSIQRRMEAQFGTNFVPTDDAIKSKESSDRARYRELVAKKLENASEAEKSSDDFAPVVHSMGRNSSTNVSKRPADGSGSASSEQKLESDSGIDKFDQNFSDKDFKGRYYADKMGYSPFDTQKHLALRKAYIEGLVWNLKYYYEGCVSWEWYYPYHYGPMISDLVNLEPLLSSVDFDGKMGKPLKPFEQLLACLPASHAYILPKPYHALMKDPDSPIIDFYPRSFTIDMNGMRFPWEAVVLLPFIDSKRLINAVEIIPRDSLTEKEQERNGFDKTVVWTDDAQTQRSVPSVGQGPVFDDIQICTAKSTNFEDTAWNYHVCNDQLPKFSPALKDDVLVPLHGLPTLRDGSIYSVKRDRFKINVHKVPSRYQTLLLTMNNTDMKQASLSSLAKHFIGNIVYMNYPHLLEGFVVGVSDCNFIARGHNEVEPYSSQLRPLIPLRRDRMIVSLLKGSGHTGSGGICINEEDQGTNEAFLIVRPFKEIVELPDGSKAKRFARFEIDVPLAAVLWKPVREDLRLVGLPASFDNDPFSVQRNLHAYNKAFKDEVQMQSKSLHTVLRNKSNVSLLNKFKGNTFAKSQTKRQFHTFTGLPGETKKKPFATLRNASFPTQPLRVRRTGRTSVIMMGAIIISSMLTIAQAAVYTFTGGVDHGRSFDAVSPNLQTVTPNFEYVEKIAPLPLQYLHGTTTLAFKFQGGLIVAVDSRASIGSFVGSKTTEKVLPISSHILGTMAGGAADCSFWIRKLRAQALLYELQEGRGISVAKVSSLLANELYRFSGLSVGTMIAGFDDSSPDPQLYYIDNSGMRLKGDMFSVGSGSTYALGIMDTVKDKFDLSVKDAVSLGIRAIRHATFRDAMSGGFINVYLITPDGGWKLIFSEDVAQRGDE